MAAALAVFQVFFIGDGSVYLSLGRVGFEWESVSGSVRFAALGSMK
jgi:hypothetical protein